MEDREFAKAVILDPLFSILVSEWWAASDSHRVLAG